MLGKQELKMTGNEIRNEFIRNVIELLEYCENKAKEGYIDYFRIGEAWRRQVTQDWLLEKGWTHAKHSNHQDFRAIDLFFFKNGKQIKNTQEKLPDGRWKSASMVEDIGLYWESINKYNRWGGHYHSFCDIAHFEILLHPRNK